MTLSCENDCGSFIFGVGGIHRLPTRQQRKKILCEAYESGFRSFDVAPAYGDGLNELELGRALQKVRNSISIFTKFGIPVKNYGEHFPNLFPFIRAAEKLLTPDYGKVYSKRKFDRHEMRRSLESSLRRLKTDRIDRYSIHEPLVPFSKIEVREIIDVARELKQEGKIVHFGVSGSDNASIDFAKVAGVDFLQTRLDVMLSNKQCGLKYQAAYGVYGHYLTQKKTSEQPITFVDYINKIRIQNPKLGLILATRSIARIKEWRECLHETHSN